MPDLTAKTYDVGEHVDAVTFAADEVSADDAHDSAARVEHRAARIASADRLRRVVAPREGTGAPRADPVLRDAIRAAVANDGDRISGGSMRR